MTTDLVRSEGGVLVRADEMDFSLVERRIKDLRKFQQSLLVEGEDHMTFSGQKKPSILKSGAEKLMLAFGIVVGNITLEERVDPDAICESVGEAVSLTPGRAEFTCTIYLTHARSGTAAGSGVGSSSSAEKKYVLGRSELKKPGEPKVVLADQLNTLRKMAKKRALIDAVLTATMASGIFTQDIEDNPEAASKETAGEVKDQPPGLPCPKCSKGVVVEINGTIGKGKKGEGNPYTAYACSRGKAVCSYWSFDKPEGWGEKPPEVPEGPVAADPDDVNAMQRGENPHPVSDFTWKRMAELAEAGMKANVKFTLPARGSITEPEAVEIANDWQSQLAERAKEKKSNG